MSCKRLWRQLRFPALRWLGGLWLAMCALLAPVPSVEAARPQPPRLPPPTPSLRPGQAPVRLPDYGQGSRAPLVWGIAASLPTPRGLLAGAAHTGQNAFYAIGGYDGFSVFDNVEAYFPALNQWASLTPLPIQVFGIQAATIGEDIYVVGGYLPDSSITNRVWRYNVLTNSWAELAPLPSAAGIATAAVAAANGKVYVIGGDDGDFYSNDTTYEYDPATNAWALKAPMPTQRENNVAVTLNGKIYVVGGVQAWNPDLTALPTLEVYDPVTDTWERKTAMIQGRGSPGIATDGVYIYVYGGLSAFKVPPGVALETTECYNPVTDRWGTTDALAVAVGGPAAAFLAGRIWAAGGFDGSRTYLDTNQFLNVPVGNCQPSSVNLTRFSAEVRSAPSGTPLWMPLALLALAGGLLALLRWRWK